MTLDSFDKTVLDESGLAQDIIKQFYGAEISQNNAKKYLSGIRMHLKHKRGMGNNLPDANDMEELIIKADGSRTTQRMVILSEEDKKSPQRLMELMGYDPVQWEMVSCKTRRNYWDVTMKMGGEGTYYAEKHTNHAYMVTITVKPIQHEITSEILRSVFEGMTPPPLAKYRYQRNKDANMLVLPILDFHLGKLAWREEAGEDYDMNIAERIYKQVVMDILEQIDSANIAIDRIVFPIGQDYFHMDTIKNTTTGGTQMDSDTRWAKMYQKGVELLVWAIEQLRPIAPVECMYVAGNHDKMLSYFATYHLNGYYRNVDSVTVDISPTVRKYVHYGNVLIGMSHGKEEGQRISGLMQIEEPEAWGKSLFREWYLGDLHHEEAKEENGINIRRLSAITATDAWHNEKGFKGAIKKAQAFIWSKKRGNRHTINSVVFGSDLIAKQ